MTYESKNVFFVQSMGRYESRRLKGFYSFARSADWHVCVIDRRQQTDSLARLVRFWHPFGCVIEGAQSLEKGMREALRGIPTVFCDETVDRAECRAWIRRAAFVRHDSTATAECAARALLRTRRENYAFVGTFEPQLWSDERERVFGALLRTKGMHYEDFTIARMGPFTDGVDYATKLKAWLKALPKPCAILAANDFIGTFVIGVCRELRLAIPEQVVLMGVDNDELCCENARPTLSSVEPDLEGAGRLSGELLAKFVAGEIAPGYSCAFGPARVVTRASSAVLTRTNRKVQKALERIRLESCKGLKASDVVAEMGGPRGSAERLFRAVTGASILEKIEARRLEEARRLLDRGNMKIYAIAQFCGYQSISFLRRRFKERFGVSMCNYRNRGDDSDRNEARQSEGF